MRGCLPLAIVVALLPAASPPKNGSGAPAPPSGAPRAGPRAARPNVRGEACELERVDRVHTPSLRCVSCHDGSVGPGIEFRMGATAGSMSHPVDVDYFSAYARQPSKYAPPGALPKDVPLVEGRVACTSCHDPASTEPNHVSRQATLCDACHRI